MTWHAIECTIIIAIKRERSRLDNAHHVTLCILLFSDVLRKNVSREIRQNQKRLNLEDYLNNNKKIINTK